MSRAIINFAEGAWYPYGQERLKRSVMEHGWDGDFVGWTSSSDLGCPPHSQVPYAFKTHALVNARAQGYESALFADASIYAVKPFDLVFTIIENEGYFFEEAGHWTGTWTTDAALEQMGLTRDEAMKIPMLTAGFVGLNFSSDIANAFLDRWHELALDGITFPGPWQNRDGAASDDPRCEGHRHDMSAASVTAHKLGMKLRTNGDTLAYIGPGYNDPRETVCFHLNPTV